MQQRGRPNRLQALWRLVTGVVSGSRSGDLVGSQEPLGESRLGIANEMRYPLEIRECPVRDPERAHRLIELTTWCYEAHHTLQIAARDAFLSKDGDDQGWGIADTVDAKGEVPIHPDTKVILKDVIERSYAKERVIGGRRLQKALKRSLAYGDCFLEFEVDRDGLGRNSDYGISRTLYLPTWEMFAVEDQHGTIVGYCQSSRLFTKAELIDSEKRKRLIEAGCLRWFEAPKVVHFIHNEGTIYGNTIYGDTGLAKWDDLKRVVMDKRIALRNLGISPNIHIMPENKDVKYLNNYQSRYEALLRKGVVTDLFMLHGGDIRKMLGVNANLDSFFREQLQLRRQIVPAGIPEWMFPGLGVEQRGTREIAREPSRAYARMRNEWCAMLTDGIRWMLDCELILRKGMDWFLENGKYRIVWTDFTDHLTVEEQAQDSNEDGIEDLEGGDRDNVTSTEEDTPQKTEEQLAREFALVSGKGFPAV